MCCNTLYVAVVLALMCATQDVVPGGAVDPMKASAVYSLAQAHTCMGGQPYVVEIKIDGNRLLVSEVVDQVCVVKGVGVG
jgi:ATP-dependent DNA ligase